MAGKFTLQLFCIATLTVWSAKARISDLKKTKSSKKAGSIFTATPAPKVAAFLELFQNEIQQGEVAANALQPSSTGLSLLQFNLLGALSNFRGTAGNVISDIVSVAAPNSCIGAQLMTGYSAEDDYPYQPACAGREGHTELTCFPADAEVITPEGRRKMKDVSIGDFLATENDKTYERVLFFTHRETTTVKRHQWMRITLESLNEPVCGKTRGLAESNGNLNIRDYVVERFLAVEKDVSDKMISRNSKCQKLVSHGKKTENVSQDDVNLAKKNITLTLSPGHFLFKCDYTATKCNTVIPARLVVVGDLLREKNASLTARLAKVVKVEKLEMRSGLYAPVTGGGTGKLIVNDILVSQFAELPFVPYQMAHWIGTSLTYATTSSRIPLLPNLVGWVLKKVDPVIQIGIFGLQMFPCNRFHPKSFLMQSAPFFSNNFTTVIRPSAVLLR